MVADTITKEEDTMTSSIFNIGYYYLVDCDDNVVGEFDTLDEAKRFADPTDIILISLSATGSRNRKATPVIKKVDKIVIDFNKNILTLKGGTAILDKISYDEGDNELETADLEGWNKMLTDAYMLCDDVTVVGIPPIQGRNITNEMSDL